MNRLRYIIPFTWKEPYKTMFSSLSDSGGWKCRIDAHEKSESGIDYKEQDIYEHILKAFSNNITDKNAIGSVWDYKTDSHKSIKKLTWFIKRPELPFYIDTEKKMPGKYDVEITQMGIYIFRNKIGFIWYEITVPDVMSSEELIEFQYFIKELNRNERSRNSSAVLECVSRTDFPECEKNVFLARLNNSPEREAGYVRRTTTKTDNMGKDIPTVRGTLYRYFALGDWIDAELARITAPQKVHIEYFSRSTNILRNSTDGFTDLVPDKANLFSYVTLDDAELDRTSAGDPSVPDEDGEKPEEKSRIDALREYAFLLANGYKRSYLLALEDKESLKFLFKNVCVAASQTGCGYFAAPTEENKAFFEGNMKDKVMLDYFFLYILALHQNYSLILYSRRIAEELSADPEEYVSSTKMKESLTAIVSEINTFFVKNVNASVSMIAHQNDFYEYVLNKLRIAKNIESVKIGLDAIYKLQLHLAEQEEEDRKLKQEEELKSREKRAQKAESNLNFSIALLSLIAIVSAFVDGHEMIGIWQNGRTGLPLTGVFQYMYNILILIITAAFFYVVYRIIKLISSRTADK